MQSTNVTIIGGGACGISLFIELFLQLRIANSHQKVAINIIEENEEVGKGLAFGTKQPGHILNTQASLMGIHFAEPAHFSEWLKKHDSSVGNEVVDNQGEDQAFTTRRLYGDYLKEQFDYYFALAEKEGMAVNLIHARAVNISREKQGFNIALSNGEIQLSDYVVLSVGTPVAKLYEELTVHKTYFDSPWPSSKIIGHVPKNEDVGILGSSLSAIDALMTLADNEHEGAITFYSLDGLMPRVQVEEPEAYTCEFLTVSNLHKIQRESLRCPTIFEVFRLFMKEAEHFEGSKIDWKKTGRAGDQAAELLKNDIKIAENGGDALMNIPYALRYESSQMWKLLDEADKLTFKKWLGGYWAANRHCMPLVNAKRINALFEKGQLKVVPKLKDVRFDDQEQVFILKCEGEEYHEKFLINATGPASAVKDMKSELIANLAKDGLIESEKVGGIKINTQTMQVITNGKSCPDFYALGHLTNGLLLDVNAVWFNVKTIGNLSQHLINSITGENSL